MAPRQTNAATAHKMTRSVNLIVIHCSATPNGKPFAVADIDRMHAERGFKRDPQALAASNSPDLHSVGYHYVIELDGAVRFGRGIDEIGAHAQGHNAHSIGICMIGTDKFMPAQWRSLRDLVDRLSNHLPCRPTVTGHRDLSPDKDGDGVVEPHEWLKTCPGFSVRDWLDSNKAVPASHSIR